MATKIRNIADLIDDLSNAYEALRDKEMSLNEALAVAKVGGKLIQSVALKLKYNQHMKIVTKINFLEDAAVIPNGAKRKGTLSAAALS